ncbi:energy-coupling factor transporter transmembrane component T family protein [Pseudothioclava arenosa]|uniref:ABC transporter permease n=1 Tax=Pseudothioclava arenosa TaxID=1795308 RepID=A0A2A4CSQ7_9RHOB|nr:energy-coupling factor transporter transmembrane component T [Pseudothioclava arenosa]PCD77380.1 ABC transporter permease [Pseudothioclava arenosa]
MLSLALPGASWAHRLPVGVKLAGLAVVMVGAMQLRDPWVIALALVGLVGLYASLGRAGLAAGLRAARSLFWIVAVILLWHLVTDQARLGLTLGLRVFLMVGLANFVTLTTPLPELIALIEWLAQPLSRLGLSPRLPALSVALMVRFIPILQGRFGQLGLAWRARSRRRPGSRLLAPLSFSLLDDAEHLAEALRARGGLAPRKQGKD